MFAFNFLLIPAFLLVLNGCATSGIPVRLTPTQTNKTLGLTFTRAYYAPTQSGEDQIVLVSDPIDEPVTSGPGEPLPELKTPPIWYVLLVDLHWRTAPSGNVDSPVASNASLHLYVFGTVTEQSTSIQSTSIQSNSIQSTGVLHYSGTGSVWVSTGKNGANVSIESSEMTLADKHGQLVDPFKAFRLKTDFHATTDNARLAKVMDDVKKAIGDADGAVNSKSETRTPAMGGND